MKLQTVVLRESPPLRFFLVQQANIRTFIGRQNPYLLLALLLTLAYHGGLSFYTYTRTYDAFVHIFFGDHYARWWWDPWDPRWYTGFTLTSYPPGSQQSIGLLSHFFGLGNSFVFVQTFAVMNCVLGIYRFSKIYVSEEAAGYAALLMVFSSSITETIHVFGQLPTTFSLGFLLNALAYVHIWLRDGDWRWLIMAWLMNAATTAGHHVTTLFGAVFFVAPVMGLAIVQKFREPLPDEPGSHPAKVTKDNLRALIFRRLRRIVPVVFRAGIYGVGMIAALVIVVLPYWLWSSSDPITQVSIPHASRDSFIENTAAGLVFWIVPYGMSMLLFPYIVYKGFTTKAWPMILSWCLLFFLGTGGTTPLPKMLLGGAFDVLTLDRFTFWATITQLPLMGEFIKSLFHGRLKRYTIEQFGRSTWRGVQIFFVVGFIVSSIWVANMTRFRKFQPAPIDPDPIVEFMDKDQHWRWRYLTLGFGDQVAWLGAQMTANSVDGNYHSARRLPEMTTTPVERLEGAKFRGIPGIGSLQQFLAVPDKYNLKFIFSNDQFYDPLLYFYGWHRLVRLGNGIMVWERDGIPPLPEVLPRKEIPLYQRIMWGTVPMGALMAGLLVLSHEFWAWRLAALLEFLGVTGLIRRLDRWLVPRLPTTPRSLFYKSWAWLDEIMWNWSQLPREDANQLVKWQVWYDWLRAIPRPRPAPPTAHAVRAAILLSIVFVSIAALMIDVQRRVRDPIGQVEAYYDDLDFRRMQAAYERLDPETRPSFDQYLLELSVLNGLVASYGKLDSIEVSVVAEEEARMVVDAELTLITALTYYTDTNRLELVKRDDTWYIMPEEQELAIPPDQFYRRGTVAWHAAGRRRVTTETTAFADVLDRPEIQILSSRLVHVDGRYHIVGELINTDVDPADLTVRGILFDNAGAEIIWYNASLGIIHKLLPKEVTPFRITFEGVAGAAITDMNTAGEFDPEAFSPAPIDREVAEFQVYGSALVTTQDLNRDVTAQDIQVVADGAGGYVLTGRLLNTGTQEATIPHVFVTYYDENNQVVWVDDYFLEGAVRTQRLQPFTLPLTPAASVAILLDEGGNYANVLANEIRFDADWLERLPMPPELGYASVRVSVHYFVLTQ